MSAALELVRSEHAQATGTSSEAALRPSSSAEHFDVVVIGGGQAGLSVGYYLARRGLKFVILDAQARVGDAWRKRWDSLRLFSPARFDALVGMPFPAPPDSFPTRDEMADYLETYARHFELPVRNSARVESLTHRDGRYVVRVAGRELLADQVVVAMASYQEPRVPELSHLLAPSIAQLHSTQYRSPAALPPGAVLVAGAGNSGAEIAHELARSGHEVWMAGRDVGQAPFKMTSFLGRLILARLLFRVLFHRVLTIRTPMGRKARPKILSGGTPLIRTRSDDLREVGVKRVPKVIGAERGLPRLEDGQVLDVTSIVWCTGFRPGFSWIDLPIFDSRGELQHQGGVVASQPGLYFVGLNFLYSMSSGMIHGVGRDAERITRLLAARRNAG